MGDHPADAVAVEDDAPVGAPRHVGHRGPFRAALRQGTVQAVGLVPAVNVEAEGGVIADAGCWPIDRSMSMAISTWPPMIGSSRNRVRVLRGLMCP